MMSTLVRLLNSSPVRCWVVPMPADAKPILPGVFFASAISSFTSFAATLGCTISTMGVRANTAIGVKSDPGL